MVYSEANLKSNGNKMSPSFRPFLIRNVPNTNLDELYNRFHINSLTQVDLYGYQTQ